MFFPLNGGLCAGGVVILVGNHYIMNILVEFAIQLTSN